MLQNIKSREKLKKKFYNIRMNDSEFIDNPEQMLSDDNTQYSLCKMCGKCCKTIVSSVSHQKLIELANQNEEEAQTFINTFKPYNSLEEARAVNPDHVDNIIKALSKNPNFNEEELAIYYCPHLTDNNTCSIYANRPIFCRRAPINGWALFPDNCGYEGWQFEERERIKTTVRKLKEQLYEVEILHADTNNEEVKNKIQMMRNKVEEKLAPYIKYGSRDW